MAGTRPSPPGPFPTVLPTFKAAKEIHLWMQTGIYNVHFERIRHVYDQYGQRNVLLGCHRCKEKVSEPKPNIHSGEHEVPEISGNYGSCIPLISIFSLLWTRVVFCVILRGSCSHFVHAGGGPHTFCASC